MFGPALGKISMAPDHGDACATWNINFRRICCSIRRQLHASQVESEQGPPPFLMYPAPLIQTKCTTSGASLQWQLALAVSQTSCKLLLFKADNIVQASLGITVRACFNLTVAVMGKNNTPLTVAKTGFSHIFGPGRDPYGLNTGLAPGDIQALQGADDVSIELKLVTSHTHIAQPTLPPGLLTCTAPMISLISLQPRILLIENFLSAEDCQRIMELAGPDLHRSRVSRGDMTSSRTSCSTFLTNQKAFHLDIQSFEERVSELTSLPAVMRGQHPLYKSEAVQVVRYQSGEFYAEHFDNKADDCAKRACTVMVYLSDVEAGGETYFRHSRGCPPETLDTLADADSLHPCGRSTSGHTSSTATAGLRIQPKQGRAIMFWSRKPNGQEDRASLHSGEAVQQGEKWIASRWLKEVHKDQQVNAEE